MTAILVATVGFGALAYIMSRKRGSREKAPRAPADFFAIMNAANDANRRGDIGAFVSSIELGRAALRPLTAPASERLDESLAPLYQAILYAPQSVSLERMLQVAVQLYSLDFRYEADQVLDVAGRAFS